MKESAESPVITSSSKSNLLTMHRASKLLSGFNMSDERRVVSAHRTLEWMASVIVCLCAFSLMMPPQVATLVLSGSMEPEGPAEEDGETTEGELVVASSRRRRCEDHRGHNLLSRASNADHIYRSDSYAASPCVKTGHQLANGLAAPLLI